MIRSRSLVFSALVLTLSLLAAGCEETPPSGAKGIGGGGGAGSSSSRCPQPGPKTGALLPAFDSAKVITTKDPCLGILGLLGEVTGLIPTDDRKQSEVRAFLSGVDRVASGLTRINDAIECGYETDRLAIGVYQHRDPRWSVGVTMVLRGGLDALAATAACYLIKQISLLGLILRDSRPPVFAPKFCFNLTRESRGGETYTIMWLGSSNVMCKELQNQLLPGKGLMAAVKAEPNVVVRSAPAKTASTVARVPAGTLGRIVCYKTEAGERWEKMTILGVTGFVPQSSLHPDGTLHFTAC